MKKILKISFVCFLLAFVMSFSLCISGCGATTTNQVFGVQFLGDYYEGSTPVFEVDLNEDTELKYKAYPSTSSSYTPVWKITKQAEVSGEQNNKRFYFGYGVIKVTDENFEQITIEISLGGYIDECFVKLKKYPDEIKVVDSTVNLYASGVYPIDLQARFSGSSDWVSINDRDYDVFVESSNETFVSVPDANKLVVYSTNDFAGSAEITINILNKKGEKCGLEKKFTVNIVQNAKSAFLDVFGHSGFVEDGGEVELEGILGTDYDLKFAIYAISVENTLITCDEVQISTNKSNYVVVDNANKKLTISAYTGLEFTVNVYTDLVDEAGDTLKLSFKVKVVS